jgi:predicted RNase H-like HicB family nuclease
MADNVLELMLELPWTKQIQRDGSGFVESDILGEVWVSEPDSELFYGTIVELPGCISQGSSEEEALKNLDDALFVWLDYAVENGLDIPTPK